MASSSSGRYQSRILSFLNRQTQRVMHQSSVALRQFKVVAVWSSQILLYPLYALFQGSRLVGRQFQQAVSHHWPRLRATVQQELEEPVSQPPTADTPIVQVLRAVQSFYLPASTPVSAADAPQDQPLSSPGTAPQSGWAGLAGRLLARLVYQGRGLLTRVEPPSGTIPGSLAPAETTRAIADQTWGGLTIQGVAVQGVASLLENRKLVLVSVGNQILDILTAEQQARLQQRIIWEVAHYWRYRKATLRLRQQAQIPLRLPGDRPQQWLPVRLFRQLMAWVQQGPVAIAANLFQEADQNPTGTVLIDWPHFQLAVPDRFSIAAARQSEPTALANPAGLVSTLPNHLLHQFHQWVQAAATYFFGGASQKLPAPEPAIALPACPESLALPEAATMAALPAAPNPQPPAPSAPNWLTWESLFGQSAFASLSVAGFPADAGMASAFVPTAPDPKGWLLPLSPQPKGALTPLGNRKAMVRPAASRSRAMGGKAVSPKLSAPTRGQGTAPLTASTPAAVTRAQPATKPVSGPSRPTDLTHSPDWIEARATAAGYVKHPIARLLEWIDRALVWLEDCLVILWRWLKRYWG